MLRSFLQSKNATLLQDLIDRQEARGPDSVADVLAEVEDLNLPRFEAEMEAMVKEASAASASQGRAWPVPLTPLFAASRFLLFLVCFVGCR